jgi:excisionase family DNA binding protein
MTTAQAAKILGVTQRRIQQLIELKEIEGAKIAGRWLVVRDSVYRYMGQK